MAAIAPPTTISGTTPGNVPQQAQAIKSAAESAGIPMWVLLGVYGAESAFGTAYHSGQTTYGYFGLTSPGLWKPADTFAQDAAISANLLAKLYNDHGKSWEAALRAYSGNSYGVAHVQGLAKSAPSGLAQAIKNLGVNLGPATIPVAVSTGIVNTVTSTAQALGSIASLVTSGSFWLRLLEAAGGIFLLALGLITLTGHSPAEASTALIAHA